MLKPILLGSAMLLAIPALAQTTNTTTNMDQGTATTATDDQATEDQATMDADATVSTQSHTGHGGMNHSTTTTTQTDTQSGAMQGTASGQTGTTTTGTAGWNNSGAAGTTGASAGTGGPFQAARNYPPCSRTVTDSCIQTHERGRRR